MSRSSSKTGLTLMCAALTLCQPVWAADPPPAPANAAVDVAKLKAQLDEQQKEIEKLRSLLETQQKMLSQLLSVSASAPASPAPERRSQSVGQVASAVPMIVPSSAAPATRAPMSLPEPTPARSASPQAPPPPSSSPLQIRLGDIGITPVGFMDATAVWRDKDAGSSIGSNFGGVPYNSSIPSSKLSEFRFSPQNSRLGFRVDGDYKGVHFLGYNEFDFLGTSGSNSIGVTNGAFVPRLRLYWVDVRKDQWEVLAGQSWSLLTPNRKGLSALPGDLFYSQAMDVNYLIGLTWTRQPGVRFLYHANNQVTFGLSLENPNQYMGGSAGGGQITLPSALSGIAGTQLDNTSSGYLSTPNLHPDIIAKLAFDPSSHAHVEIAGIERTFKIYNTTTGTPTSGQYSTKAGVGGSINANLELFKGFRLITNNFWSDGGGRYIFGQAPDVIVRADGTLSPVHSGGFNDGFEWTLGNTILWGYYGGAYIGRNVALDTTGAGIGYGFGPVGKAAGAPNSQNKLIQEGTIGFTQTFWKDPKYGALSFIGQYEYLMREPWFIAPNSPKATHDNTIYIDLRYTLPGAPPPAK